MRNYNTQPIITLGVSLLRPFLYYGSIVCGIIYADVQSHGHVLSVIKWWVMLVMFGMAHTLVNLSETRFILTAEFLIIKKPFLPFLFDKTFPLGSISKVECQYQTGKTLQPSILVHLKSGERWFWWTSASRKRVTAFLSEVEKLGVKTDFSGNQPNWRDEE